MADKKDDYTHQDFMELIWSIDSCEEAVEIFRGDMYQCPVCLSYVDEDGVVMHKNRKDILQ